MRLFAVTLMAWLAWAAASEARPPSSPCQSLRPNAVAAAIDYGFARSSEGDLAYAPDLTVRLEIAKCRALSRRRARFSYGLVVRDETRTVIEENGVMVLTRKRVAFTPERSFAAAGPAKGVRR